MKLKDKYKREYRIWKAMRSRCNAPCFKDSRYRKKGIKCCREWNSFEKFLSDMGPCPDGYSIDRIDNDGNYEASNCRWADNNTQAKNRGNFTPLYTYKGKTHILKDWSRILHIKYTTLVNRMKRHALTFEEAVEFQDPRTALIHWKGKEWTRKELCEEYNIPLINFYDRKYKGWPLKRILETPVHKR